ncbi:MAG: AAA family ATPase, partial [Candidatus Nanohaloarchaea archaeon]
MVVTDARVLSEEFVPRELQHRDGEVGVLTNALEPLIDGDPAEDVLVHGPSGAGKTAVARY